MKTFEDQPDIVSDYISIELAKGRKLGPFSLYSST